MLYFNIFVLLTLLFTGQAKSNCPVLCQCTIIDDLNLVSCNRKGLQEVPIGLPNNTISLDLGYNAISSLENLQWQSLHKLEVLVLKENKLFNLNLTTIEDLTELMYLDISLNSLYTFDISNFKYMKKLETVIAKAGTIQTVILEDGPPSIMEIVLDYNYIHDIKIGPNFAKSMPKLHAISIQNNYLNCCHSYDELKEMGNIVLLDYCFEPLKVRWMNFTVAEPMLPECQKVKVDNMSTSFNSTSINDATVVGIARIISIVVAMTAERLATLKST